MNNVSDNHQRAQFRRVLRRWQIGALVAGIVGTAASAGAALVASSEFWTAYLTSFLFWWQITIGFLGLSLLRCIVRSNWGNATWPYLKASLVTVPLSAILFLPIVMGLTQIFPWAEHPAPQSTATQPVAATDESGEELAAVDNQHSQINSFQAAYFNHTFFWGRCIAYFIVWLGASLIAARAGTVTGDSRLPRRLASFALIGLVLTVTFASFDWGMSLEPQWYSTIYGAMILISGAVGALSILVLSWALLLRMPRVPGLRIRTVTGDLGNLLLAFLMIWSYFAFSQYLIIWSGNLPSEVTWYVRRGSGSWQIVLLLIIAFHFVIPFFALLSRERKQHPRKLAWFAGILLAANVLQTIWTYSPAFVDEIYSLHWSLLASLLAVGGWWTLAYTTALVKCLNDTALKRVTDD